MTSLSPDTGEFSSQRRTHGLSGILSSIGARWQEYRLMRDLESVPHNIMKDVGYLAAAERMHAE